VDWLVRLSSTPEEGYSTGNPKKGLAKIVVDGRVQFL
jgi:hypothetical protein